PRPAQPGLESVVDLLLDFAWSPRSLWVMGHDLARGPAQSPPRKSGWNAASARQGGDRPNLPVEHGLLLALCRRQDLAARIVERPRRISRQTIRRFDRRH